MGAGISREKYIALLDYTFKDGKEYSRGILLWGLLPPPSERSSTLWVSSSTSGMRKKVSAPVKVKKKPTTASPSQLTYTYICHWTQHRPGRSIHSVPPRPPPPPPPLHYYSMNVKHVEKDQVSASLSENEKEKRVPYNPLFRESTRN